MRRRLALLLAILLTLTLQQARASGPVTQWPELRAALARGDAVILIGAPIQIPETLELRGVTLRGVTPNAGLYGAPIAILGEVAIEALGITPNLALEEGTAVTVRAGGGLRMLASQVCMTATDFEGITGIAVEADATLELQDSFVEGGAGAQRGGDALRIAGNARVRGGSLTGGAGKTPGRGLFTQNALSVTVEGTAVSAPSQGEGPAILCTGGTLSLTNCQLTGTPAVEAVSGARAVLSGCNLYADGVPLRAGAEGEIVFADETSGILYPEGTELNEGGGTLAGVATDFIVPSSLEISVGESAQVDVRLLPEGAMLTPLHWSSGDPSIAMVNTGGKVMGMGIGKTVITVRLGSEARHDIAVTVAKMRRPDFEVSQQPYTLSMPEVRDVIITWEEEAEGETVSLYTAGEEGAVVRALPDADSQALCALEPGSLALATGGGDGAFRMVRLGGETGYIHARELVERSWRRDGAGHAAATIRSVNIVRSSTDITLPVCEPLLALVTIGDWTAALWNGSVAYLPADTVCLMEVKARVGAVETDEWATLYAEPEEDGEVRAYLAAGVPVEIGTNDETPKGWALVKVGRIMGYLNKEAILELDE